MTNVRQFTNIWNKKTYKEEFENLLSKNKTLKKQALKLLKELKLIDLPMNGFSCEKLLKTHEQKIKLKKTYSEIFHDKLINNCLTPASYLLQLIKECKKIKDLNNDEIKGILARGLRAFTSLLREQDFADQLQDTLAIYDKFVVSKLNSKQDSKDHTDVLLTYKSKTYRIWLYQFSSRGLPHDIERLTGKRGELPNGIHIICPLHTEIAIPCKKLKNKIKTIKNNYYKSEQKLKYCSKRAQKTREKIEEKIKNYKNKLRQLKSCFCIKYKASIKELNIVKGWFFYSEAYIKRTVDYINNLNPINYTEVVEILSGPERFVGTMQSFLKEN